MSQRGRAEKRRLTRPEQWVLHKCRATPLHPPGPAKTPYRVRMRNTPGPPRGTWAAYVQTARERAGLDKTQLGRRIGKDRATVTRWEDGKNRPGHPDLVALVAEVLGLDLDEALAAAGMRPGVPAPEEPSVRDEEREMILSSKASPRLKAIMLQRLEELRERDKQRRMEDIRFLLEQGS